jgi:hypothetical protein
VSLTLAQLGLIHEYGNEHIPARPFLIPALQEGRASLQALTGQLLKRVVLGRTTMRDALGKLGAEGEAMVKTKIRNGDFVELAESTIRKKGSSQPLIDTGQMLNAVQWEYDNE